MSNNTPEDLKYAKSHEWVKDNQDGTVTVGITDHAQDLLGDIVFVELPEQASNCEAEKEFENVQESVQEEINLVTKNNKKYGYMADKLEAEPELVNSDPYGDGWLCKIKLADAPSLNALLDAKAYSQLVEEES